MTRLRKILLFSRDSGGANTLIPLIKPLKSQGFDLQLFGKDMALKKYKEAGFLGKDIESQLSVITVESLSEFLKQQQPDFILSGTSGEDPTEKYLWKAAQNCGIPSAAILDQWLNYGIRFSEYGVSQQDQYEEKYENKYKDAKQHPYLPTHIFVMDDEAKDELVKAGLQAERIEVTGQPYFQWFQKQWQSKSTQHEKTEKELKQTLKIDETSHIITFISEPLSQLKRDSKRSVDFGYTEKSIFNELLKSLQKIEAKNIIVFVKLHPRENPKNYDSDNFKDLTFPIIINQSLSTEAVLSLSYLICGMTSMMLIEAFLAQKPLLNIQIGLNKENPCVLAKRGLIQTILSPEDLSHQLSGQLTALSKLSEKKTPSILPDFLKQDAIQNILSFLSNYPVSPSNKRLLPS